MNSRRFCWCDNPQLRVEGGTTFCHRCGYELEPAPPPDPAELIAAKVVEMLAGRLGRQPREPWVGVDAAARHLHCSPQRIYDLCSRAGLPHAKEGTRSLFRLSEVDAWLERRKSA